MKQLIIFIFILTVSSLAFAGYPSIPNTLGTTSTLHTAPSTPDGSHRYAPRAAHTKAHLQLINVLLKDKMSSPQPQSLKHDLVIVYGGADISSKTKIYPHKIIV